VGQLTDSRRDEVAQEPPSPELDLTGFPAATPKVPVFRAHLIDRGPWFFASDDGGRFNLSPPRGTCYLADTPAAAVRERLGQRIVVRHEVSFEAAAEMQVSALDAGGRYAHVSSAEAAGFEVTGELAAMTPYEVPRAWATEFDAAAFDGVAFAGRFSLTTAWGLFGAAGPDDSRPIDATPLSGVEACALIGVTVLPKPPTTFAALRIVEPG